MAPKTHALKRKRISKHSTPNKRRRETGASSAAEPQFSHTGGHESESSETYWAANRILDETRSKYLIEWKGTDPKTREPYRPSWEPKKNANWQLKADWETRRAASRVVAERVGRSPAARAEGPVRRPQRVIDSSQEGLPIPPAQAQGTATVERGFEVIPPATSRPDLGRPAVRIQIPRRGDFDPTEFEQFSQIVSSELSQRAKAPAISPQSAISSPSVRAVRQRSLSSSGIVSDSQDPLDSASYVPTTQEASESIQEHSSLSATNGSNDSNGELQDSGDLTDLVELASHRATLETIGSSDPIETSSTASQRYPKLGGGEESEDLTIEIPESPTQPDPDSVQETPARVNAEEDLSSQGFSSAAINGGGDTRNIPEDVCWPESFLGHRKAVEAQRKDQQLHTHHALNHSSGKQSKSLSRPAQQTSPPFDPDENSQPQARTAALGSRTSTLHIQERGVEVDQVSSAHSEVESVHPSEYSQPCESSTSGTHSHTQTSTSEQQHAQVVPLESYHSTQDDSVGSIRPTTEIYEEFGRSTTDTSESRHDSSQESPIHAKSLADSLSPSQSPPSHSLDLVNSTAPLGPQTPDNVTSLTANMSQTHEDMAKKVDKMMRESQEKDPWKPTRVLIPTVAPPTGTRSPSTIPDRPPQQREPTSLRTSALTNLATIPSEKPSQVLQDAANARIPDVDLSNVDHGNDKHMEIYYDKDVGTTDAWSEENNSESLLIDDLDLLDDAEYIVPLAIEGRQKAMYDHELSCRTELLHELLQRPEDFDQGEEVNSVIQKLRAQEIHIDLVLSETDISSQLTGPRTQAQWDYDNSVKFRFLGTLLEALRESRLRITVVVQKNDERIFSMLVKFFQGKLFNYKYPAKGEAADPSSIWPKVLDAHMVTILSMDTSPLSQPPDAIICLDGPIPSAEIRKKMWAKNPDLIIVPIIHLVVPRSVGHIERYVSPVLNEKTRLYTIVSMLAKLSDELGQPFTETPRAPQAAELVANFLIEARGGPQPEWPLPPIGDIKSLIESVESRSQGSVPSPPVPVNASKRPLETEDLEPPKRMRMTPQPLPNSSGSNQNNDITHVSDSMPGTAVQASAQLQEVLDTRKSQKVTEKHLREMEASLDRRHTEFEDLKKLHKDTLKELGAAKVKIQKAENGKELAQERLQKRSTELEELRRQLSAQQKIDLASEDEKVAEIARLTKELADTKASEERALKKAQSTESTLEYTKEQYRLAQDRASELKDSNDALTSQNAELARKASTQVAELKKIHIGRTFAALEKKNEQMRTQNENLVRMLQQKEDEIARLTKQRTGAYGTRGSSVPRSPRVGPASRANSPLAGNNRDRLSNLRNG